MRAVLIYTATVLSILATNSTLVLGQTAPGDFDGDATITLEDHRALSDCLTGPGTEPVGGPCAVGDFDCDGDVDLRDWRWIQSSFDGTPPLAAGCCESSTDEFLSAVASNPVASAAFHDSWQLATGLGFAPTLHSVIRCEMSDGLTSFTAALGSANGLATISLILGVSSNDAWAPIMLSTGSESVKVFDASGGLIVEGIGTALPTITELDANGNPVDSLSLSSLSDVTAGSQGCVDYFNACFKQAGADILAEILSETVGDLAIVGACNWVPGAGLVCDAAALTLLGLNGAKIVAKIAAAIPECLHKVTSGDYRCAELACVCNAYGTCRKRGANILCEGVGDRCRDYVSGDLRCKVDATQTNGFRCDLSVCGDGVPDPLIGEECDIVEAPYDGCGVSPVFAHPSFNGPCLITSPGERGQPHNCIRARCGDQLRCDDPACTSGPNGGPEECDDGNNIGGDGCAADCHREECGNGILDPGEECDDADDAACPGQCVGPSEPDACTCVLSCSVFSGSRVGFFQNTAIPISLGNLPSHTQASVSFDLRLRYTWDGDSVIWGPDIWQLTVLGGPILIRAALNNPPVGDLPGLTGTDVFWGSDPTWTTVSTSHFTFTFSHSGDSLVLVFSAEGLQTYCSCDENWDLPRIEVTVTGSCR